MATAPGMDTDPGPWVARVEPGRSVGDVSVSPSSRGPSTTTASWGSRWGLSPSRSGWCCLLLRILTEPLDWLELAAGGPEAEFSGLVTMVASCGTAGRIGCCCCCCCIGCCPTKSALRPGSLARAAACCGGAPLGTSWPPSEPVPSEVVAPVAPAPESLAPVAAGPRLAGGAPPP